MDANTGRDTTEQTGSQSIALERKIYRQPHDGQLRELWRPGDNDGDPTTDYFDRKSGPLPLGKRWRLFQSDIGLIRAGKNEPPKYVLLDDCAAWEVIESDIPRAHLSSYWPHDFGVCGKLRARRPHCGRGALKKRQDLGTSEYHSISTGRNKTYQFTGDEDYVPTVYKIAPKPRIVRSPSHTTPFAPHARSHNQYTPKDQLVKNGAPSLRHRLDHADTSPHHELPTRSDSQESDKAKLYTGLRQEPVRTPQDRTSHSSVTSSSHVSRAHAQSTKTSIVQHAEKTISTSPNPTRNDRNDWLGSSAPQPRARSMPASDSPHSQAETVRARKGTSGLNIPSRTVNIVLEQQREIDALKQELHEARADAKYWMEEFEKVTSDDIHDS